VRRDLLDRLDVGRGDWSQLVERVPSAVAASGERLYAADRFNFARPAGGGAARHDLRVDVYGPGSRHTEASHRRAIAPRCWRHLWKRCLA